MQIGGAVGSVVAGYVKVDPRQRRILLVAGVAAGMAAVFRTPLGAALLAVEILYRDDFESDALIPALLASVVSYSISVTLRGEGTLLAHAPSYPFMPAHLPWYALMALLIAMLASAFVGLLRRIQRLAAEIRAPVWAKPAIGGLALGIAATPVVMLIGPRIGEVGQGIGIFGGGYGAAQVAITGSSWLPTGWRGAELLLLAGVMKIVATALTVGSGGSAGDFGPSLVMGGLFGGAFGRALQGLLGDAAVDPGAFALVGMGTFYGGIAHVPVSSLVMVCELAGSYDLLVPLMLAEGIAFVALRKRSLYHAQVPTKRDSPAHRDDFVFHALAGKKVGDLPLREHDFVTFDRATPGTEIERLIAATDWQLVFPVLDGSTKICGHVNAEVLRTMTTERGIAAITVAADLMDPPVTVRRSDDLHWAMELMLRNQIRELVIVDEHGKIAGFVDESDITRAYLEEIAEHKPS
jgi:CIC family chloride channel protein